MRPEATRCLLLIDDEPAQRRLVTAIGARAGWWVQRRAGCEAAARLLKDEEGKDVDAILLDPWLPGPAGTQVIEQIRALRPDLPLLILTAQTSVAVAVEAMRAGANDFLVKPLAPDRLLAALNAATDRRQRSGELRPLSEKISKSLAFDEIVGSTPEFRSALAIAAKAARARAPVLIEGERGTGKEVLAQAIHSSSPRNKRPMIIVNCGAIPKTSSIRCCSATKRAPSPARSTAISAASRMPTARPCSWTRSASCRSKRRSSCCARSKAANIQRVGSRIVQTVDVRIIAATTAA
jgi:DNA-binding NtrC family response regulator